MMANDQCLLLLFTDAAYFQRLFSRRSNGHFPGGNACEDSFAARDDDEILL